MGTLLTLVPTLVFDVLVHLAPCRHFGCFEGLWGRGSPLEADPGIFGASFRVNEASYTFIAAIIAGMPIMFITRVIL